MTKLPRLTAKQKRIAAKLLAKNDLGSLHACDEEFVFAWLWLHPEVAINKIQFVGNDTPLKKSCLNGIQNFLHPITDADRFPIHINAVTGRVSWRLELLPGVGHLSAALIMQTYCTRNVTRQMMAEEMARLRTGPRGVEILEEAARRDAAFVAERVKAKKQNAKEVRKQIREELKENRWHILRLARDFEIEMGEYVAEKYKAKKKLGKRMEWKNFHDEIMDIHDRALRAFDISPGKSESEWREWNL